MSDDKAEPTCRDRAVRRNLDGEFGYVDIYAPCSGCPACRPTPDNTHGAMP